MDDGIVEDIIVVMRSLSLLTEFSPQLTFVDEVPPVQGGRQLAPGLLYIDDKGAKYKVKVNYLKAFFHNDYTEYGFHLKSGFKKKGVLYRQYLYIYI